MIRTTYYTVITHSQFSLVKYAQSPVYEVLTFPTTFADLSEAEHSIKHSIPGKLERLPEATFARKVKHLHSCYKQELAKLADWNSGRTRCR